MSQTPIPPPETHLSAEAIYDLLDGRLDPTAAQAAEAHLWRCDRCRMLREECAALLSSLRWYGADPPAPPDGYWDELWGKVSLTPRPRARRLVPALALAASIAVLLSIQPWRESTPTDGPVAAGSPEAVAPGPQWASEYRLFEQATIAIGSVDPLSKGIVLASLSESR
ncbi:MAG: zf-HC2 domain-containing protein [Gemmatimonadota bacterium]